MSGLPGVALPSTTLCLDHRAHVILLAGSGVLMESALRILHGVVDPDEYPDVRYTGEARELRDGLSDHVLVLQEQLDLDALAAAVSAALDGEHGATV